MSGGCRVDLHFPLHHIINGGGSKVDHTKSIVFTVESHPKALIICFWAPKCSPVATDAKG